MSKCAVLLSSSTEAGVVSLLSGSFSAFLSDEAFLSEFSDALGISDLKSGRNIRH
jgi:hypothetical protein